MGTLLFIRHAETDMAGRFCGHSNPPVNERGHHQMKKLLKALDGESIDAIYTSDLTRALMTADAISRRFGLSPIPVPGLREIDFGEWEGLNWQEIESRDAVYARKWSDAYPQLPAPGGELFEKFRSRVTTEVERLQTVPEHKTIAVVTHSGVMRVVLCAFCGFDEKEAWEKTKTYCSFFRHAYEGRSQ